MTNKKLSFVIDDFIADTFSMTAFQKGCYMNVVAGQSKRGRLTIPDIKQILMDDFEEAWPSIEYIFEIDEKGMYYIESLDRSLSKKKKLRENALKRWGNVTSTNTSSFQTTSGNAKWQAKVKEHPAMGNINFSAPVKKLLGTTDVSIPKPTAIKVSPMAKSTKQITASPKPKVATITEPPTAGGLEEYLKMAFGEEQIANLEAKYKETNILLLIADFIKKVRAVPENYESHDLNGIKYAFIDHLKEHGKDFVKFDKKAIEERRAKELEAEEGGLEERIKMAFGDMQITNFEMQYKETNIPRLLDDFLKKVRSLPENYENHDVKGLKYAFIAHLKTYGKNFVKGAVPMVIDSETGVERPEYYTTPHLTPEQQKVLSENLRKANESHKKFVEEEEKRRANSKPITEEQRKILEQKRDELNKRTTWVHDDNQQDISKYEWKDDKKDEEEDDIPKRIAKLKEEMARKKALAEEEEKRKAGTKESAQ